jgi:hypothetical protein
MGLGVFNVYIYLFHAPVCFAHENIKKNCLQKSDTLAKLKIFSMEILINNYLLAVLWFNLVFSANLDFFLGLQAEKKSEFAEPLF